MAYAQPGLAGSLLPAQLGRAGPAERYREINTEHHQGYPAWPGAGRKIFIENLIKN